MSLLPRSCLLIALTGFLFACQVSTPVTGDVTPNAVAGDAIEVTALDDAAAAPVPVVAGGLATAPAQETAPPAPVAETPVPAPVPVADAAEDAPAVAAAPETEPAEVVPPPPPKSPLQIACERKRGRWADTGGGLKTCVVPTRDGGERCTRENQCEGVCLARSGTCAPAIPMLGCNDILQDNGVRATECIE